MVLSGGPLPNFGTTRALFSSPFSQKSHTGAKKFRKRAQRHRGGGAGNRHAIFFQIYFFLTNIHDGDGAFQQKIGGRWLVFFPDDTGADTIDCPISETDLQLVFRP